MDLDYISCSLFPLGQMRCWHYHLLPELLDSDQFLDLWIYASQVYSQYQRIRRSRIQDRRHEGARAHFDLT